MSVSQSVSLKAPLPLKGKGPNDDDDVSVIKGFGYRLFSLLNFLPAAILDSIVQLDRNMEIYCFCVSQQRVWLSPIFAFKFSSSLHFGFHCPIGTHERTFASWQWRQPFHVINSKMVTHGKFEKVAWPIISIFLHSPFHLPE